MNNQLRPSQVDNRNFSDSLAQNVQMESLLSRFVEYSRSKGDEFRPYKVSTDDFAEKYHNIKRYESIDIDLFDVENGFLIPNENFYNFISFYEKVDTKDINGLLARLNGIGVEKVSNILVPHNKKRREIVTGSIEQLKEMQDKYYYSIFTGREHIKKTIDCEIRDSARSKSDDYWESVQNEIRQEIGEAQDEMSTVANEHGARIVTTPNVGKGWERTHLVVGDGKLSTHKSIMSHNLEGHYGRGGWGNWTKKPKIDYYGTTRKSIIRDVPSLDKE